MKLLEIVALATVVNTEKQQKETCLDTKKWKNFDSKTGKLGYFVNTAKRIITHKIDRPNTQCKLITRFRKTYFQLTHLRRRCLNKSGKARSRSDKKQAREKKQADRKNKKRSRRETEEIVEDESLNEVIDSSAEGELNSIYQDLTGEVTEEKLQNYCTQEDLDQDEETDCAEREGNREQRTKAEMNYRIAFLCSGIESWVRTYVTPVGICKAKVANWSNRMRKIRRRVQETRRSYPANKKQLNMEITKPVNLWGD